MNKIKDLEDMYHTIVNGLFNSGWKEEELKQELRNWAKEIIKECAYQVYDHHEEGAATTVGYVYDVKNLIE